MSHSRPGTPSSLPAPKKAKTSHNFDAPVNTPEVFHPGLLDAANAQALHEAYTNSHPFKYAVIDHLFDDSLLVKVRLRAAATSF